MNFSARNTRKTQKTVSSWREVSGNKQNGQAHVHTWAHTCTHTHTPPKPLPAPVVHFSCHEPHPFTSGVTACNLIWGSPPSTSPNSYNPSDKPPHPPTLSLFSPSIFFLFSLIFFSLFSLYLCRSFVLSSGTEGSRHRNRAGGPEEGGCSFPLGAVSSSLRYRETCRSR